MLCQENYVNQLLKKFKMTDNYKYGSTKKLTYQQLIGSLMYLAVLTQPDIAFNVSYLSRFNNHYVETHWKAAKRVLRYLKGNKDVKLMYKWDGGDQWDLQMRTGLQTKLIKTLIQVIYLSLVMWQYHDKVKNKKSVALSSTESEYLGISDSTKEAIYMLSQLIIR